MDNPNIPEDIRLSEARRIVLPHLELDVKDLPDSTKMFVEALAAFVANPEDVTGMKVYNLRDMAKDMERAYRRIGSQLTQLER